MKLWKNNPRNKDSLWRQVYLLEHRKARQHKFTLPSIPSYKGLRTTSCTYVRYDDRERELYNLQQDQDPWQLNNVANLVPSQIITAYEKRLKSLGSCRGKSCRQQDLLPLPDCKANESNRRLNLSQ